MPPADPGHRGGRRAVQSAVARQERKCHAAADYLERRLDGAGDGPDQRGLARTGFAGQSVNLPAPHFETDAVDRLDVTFDGEVAGAKMSLPIAYPQERP